MRNPLYFLFLITLFVSCKSNTKTLAADTVVQTKSVVNQVGDQDLIKKFSPIVQGVWVKKDYIEKVGKTKSPLEASDLATGITVMNVNTDRIKGDSLVVPVGLGNHEGGEITLRFKQGKRPSTIIATNYDSIDDVGYLISKSDTTLVLYSVDDKTHRPVFTTYVKSLNRQPENDLAFGMNYIINKNLISGNYIGKDSLDANVNVKFYNDGKMVGIAGLNTFFIEDDLGSEPLMNLDGIVFNFNTKQYKFYSFKINADTLNLYDTYPNADSTKLVLGKRVYKLVRQK